MSLRYNIYRECWNEKTNNGYVDNPYWRISFSFYEIGLKDDGEFWYINNSSVDKNNSFVRESLNTIIKECKLKIKLKWKRKNKYPKSNVSSVNGVA